MLRSKLVITLAISIFAGTIITAQELENERKERRQKRTKIENQRFGKLAEELDLSAEQKKEIFELVKEAKAEKKELRGQFNRGEKPTEEERAAIKAAREESRAKLDAEIMTVLNEEQRSQYQEIIAERNAKMEQRAAKKEALRVYREENIQPVLKAQRLKLENSITVEDKELIADLQSRTNKKALKGKRGKGKRQNQIAREDRENLKKLVETYKDDIDALHNEIADQEKEWKAYMESMRPEVEDDEALRKRGDRKGKKKGKGNHKYAAFLLMDIDR